MSGDILGLTLVSACGGREIGFGGASAAPSTSVATATVSSTASVFFSTSRIDSTGSGSSGVCQADELTCVVLDCNYPPSYRAACQPLNTVCPVNPPSCVVDTFVTTVTTTTTTYTTTATLFTSQSSRSVVGEMECIAAQGQCAGGDQCGGTIEPIGLCESYPGSWNVCCPLSR
jgi:hypothetical protein